MGPLQNCYFTQVANRTNSEADYHAFPWQPLVLMILVAAAALGLSNYCLAQKNDWSWISDGSFLGGSNMAILYALIPAAVVELGLLAYIGGSVNAQESTPRQLPSDEHTTSSSVTTDPDLFKSLPAWVGVYCPSHTTGYWRTSYRIAMDETFNALTHRLRLGNNNRYVVPTNPIYWICRNSESPYFYSRINNADLDKPIHIFLPFHQFIITESSSPPSTTIHRFR